MDSWTLQRDSYSFLRSAPHHAFSLCHRDGSPNHVEIFDIINVPNQRSAISETTCLCDIFGDDCESPSLSSSPAIGAFVPLHGTTAASPLVDDLNDSSSSYHTAPGSSEGEEGFEDSRERVYSPPLQSESSERRQLVAEGLTSGLPKVSEDRSPHLEPESKSPVPQFSTASPPSSVLNTGESTPSPGHNSPFTLSTEGSALSLSSSSVEKRFSPSSPSPRQAHQETDPLRTTPTYKDRLESLSPSPSPEPRNCVSSSSSESVNTQLLPEFRIAQGSPEPRSSCFIQHSSPSPETTSKDFSLDFSESAFDSGAALLSSSITELSSQSRDSLASPELINRPYSLDTQASSPFSELSGRVSLPDLLSRGSTPDNEDYTHTPELILDYSSAGGDATTTPESKDTGVSAVSTPAPRHTPPTPVISIATSPELVQNSGSPELTHKAPSPGLLCAPSPATTGTRTPSPDPSHKIRHISTPPESRTQVTSPVVSCSLSPSPKVTSSCSPTDHIRTAPSPAIRITASSPEVSRREWSSEVETTPPSPFLDPHFDCASSRSLTSSPHITGISYSVVQPEDRDSPPFPELSRLSTPEPDRTLVFPEARIPSPSRDSVQSSRAESTRSPRISPHLSGFTSSVLQPDITLSHQPRYKTPSPLPEHHTPSPEPRYPTPLSDKYQSPSPQHKTRDTSPVAPSPEQRYHQHSQATLSTEHNPHGTRPTPPLRNTPEVEGDSSSVDITEKEYPTHLAKESVSPAFKVVEVTPKVANPQDNSSFPEEKQIIDPTFSQKEDTYNNLSIEVKSPSPNRLVSKDRSPGISPVYRATTTSPVQILETAKPQLTTYSPTSESSSSLKSACTPEPSTSQLSPKVRRETRERITEDMAHRVSRRRTPSPPLTRFTPVHIIAPEKPYRPWQNRSHSPSQVVASSPSGNLKKVVTNRESPNVAYVDNNSQAHWVRQGRQLEMEREMQLEEEREVSRHRKMDREMERERKKREERVPEKGKGGQWDASYRREQAELSFNARNRKGSASRSTAPTSRETRQGLPTVHSYSESVLATRQLQQQQSLLRFASQQDSRGGGLSRRRQPPAPHNKSSGPGRVAVNRPCRSSSSSMGSELDEADDEVKWFTDSAFLSLSSPEVDYLDMYNSSHRSSTNNSQPSTQESPAGVSGAWPAYADFRGSAPRLDNDELPFQQPLACLDPSMRHEMDSFECVDVAVEREDYRRVRRGVPKRQIQLKRKSNCEGKQDESSANSSPGLPGMVESPSLESYSRESFMRQHSTPAAMQECYTSERSPERNQQNERKLQKSASLDETCTKTKMATCLIKSVLCKKMQGDDKQPDEHAGEEGSPAFDENRRPPESAAAPLKESPQPDSHHLNSRLQSDHSLSSEGLPARAEPRTKDESKPQKSFRVRSSNRPSSSSSSRSVNFSLNESEVADSQSTNAASLRSEMRSELKVPSDSKQSTTGVQRADDSETWDGIEGGDSANATARNSGAPSATEASSMQVRMINRDQECGSTEDHKQLQQDAKGAYMSQTPEITVRAVEKKKASLNVCLTPEAENKPWASFPDIKKERLETSVNEKTEEEEGNGNNKAKVPIHKVRDVRRLVKNTYNLSFKATSAVMPSNVEKERMDTSNRDRREEIKDERREEFTAPEEREVRQAIRREEDFRVERKEEQKEEVKDSKRLTLSPSLQSKPMQIQYKAVFWKEDKNKTSCAKKDSENPGDKPQAAQKLVTQVSRQSHNTTGDAAIPKSCQHDVNKTLETQDTMMEVHKVSDNENKPVVLKTDRKPPMLGSLPKLPSKEREVSTAVVLIRDGSSKTKISASPAQKEIPTLLQAPAASHSPGPTSPSGNHASGGHSVSMLLKEKGYQADIGAVVGDMNGPGNKVVTRKHVNCLEIPLQTSPSHGGRLESHRERTFSSSSTTSGPSAASNNTDTPTKAREDESVSSKPAVKDTAKEISVSPLRNTQEQTPPAEHKELGDFEAVKRLDPTFPPRFPAVSTFKPQAIEVKSLSKETQKQESHTNITGNSRPQTIEVKSIAKTSQKPAVPPKPSCKFKPADLGAMSSDTQTPSATTVRPQAEERPQTIVVSSPTIYRKISNESTSTSNYTRKLAVSAVSSLKPPSCKATATTISNLSNQSTASETEAYNDRGQQQKPGFSPQSSRYTQRPTTLATAPISATGPGFTSAPGTVSDPKPNHVPGPESAVANQPSQPAVMDPESQPQYPRLAYPHEQAMPVTPNSTKQPAAVSTTQVPGYTPQPCCRSLSSERSQRTDDLLFYASDDPPSYDERESFSPLMLPDLNHRRSNRYQPSSRPPPCSCTAGCPSHPGLTPPHHHHSPHNLTPPAPPHSPGQALPYSVAQPALRLHQCRPDAQPLSYQPGSPKLSPLGPSQPPTMYQPLHQPPPCPPHPSLMQTCPADRPLYPPQHIDPRRPPVHRSPQQQPPSMAGAPYSDPGHSHSPGLPPMDPQYLCGPQSLGPSYGSEYGGDSSSLYSESSYGQTPRRVLLDPETGKYFYIEVPMQPLRKMLFDPETGQYVEVLIPQQAMSHSSLYPPAAAPYTSLHNPNMYAPAPQYMPYAAPPPQAHPQAQPPQPPRYPEASVAATMHPGGPGVHYRNPSGQSKPDPQSHPPLDQSYLDSMYYVPTGMNASPNPTPPDYYHKHPPNRPPTGGKRS
ncbi:serine/arginine repetitive matrix protein 2 [Cyclopterus lumpus]|uniref:serine/arginine repetitive matrix protein 2 n=1 Tax=Cyclopterus lumpus TaxID=8103 RepID=UPI0014864AFB|nr:serine/arginine repetitive matrix protein 2 [Cyclopterus lumpus]